MKPQVNSFKMAQRREPKRLTPSVAAKIVYLGLGVTISWFFVFLIIWSGVEWHV